AREFYQEFFALAAHSDTPATDFDERATRFAGTFISWRGSFSQIEKLLGLLGQVTVAPDGQGGLMIGERRFVEIGDRLFRDVENGDLVAFQENDQGDIIGYVQDGLSIISMYKAGGQTSQAFNFGLLGLAVIVFLAVLLRYLYQRDRLRALQAADKSANRAAALAAVSHLWVLIFGAVVAVAVGDQFMARIPLLFKLWLIFPIIASLASFYLLYQTVLVWKNGLLAGNFGRIRYSIVSLCALFMTWFYYYWNILGFNYFG
ncbi:MAG: serine hydrolase, partial [Proteobacteria bacterium]|nr:serine hydrolase [Pseudomonadota bacterium]